MNTEEEISEHTEANKKFSEPKKRKLQNLQLFDEEAHEDSDEDDLKRKKQEESNENNPDDDDDDEEDDTNYVADDFLVDDLAEKASSDEEEPKNADKKQKPARVFKKLKKRKDSVMLDEEDYFVMQENTTNAASDTRAKTEKSIDFDEENFENAEELADEEADNELNAKSSVSAADNRNRRDFDYQDEDEMADFIEDEDDGEAGEEGDENRKPSSSRERAKASRALQQRQSRGGTRETGLTFDQMQEAFDIFGQGYDDYDEDYPEGIPGQIVDEMDVGISDVTADGGKEGDAAEDEQELQKKLLARKEMRIVNKLRSKFERSQLVGSFCLDRDEELRQIDRPERLQQLLPRKSVPDATERRREVFDPYFLFILARWLTHFLQFYLRLNG